MKGTVKWYNPAKGYGFIVGDDKKEYFVHHSQLPEGAVPQQDESVTFETKETEKGLQAASVVLSSRTKE
ncbi:cold shock domain-containing protein [Candidatus Woesearchaeota archaeon]|nr:cold shock domain-containing protein [Candidatus Woesearchaeota archaeon]